MPDPEKPRGLRRVLRIARRTLLVVFGLVVVAVGIALIAVHTDWGRNKIRGVIESSLDSTFAGGAKVRAFEGSILGDFTIEGIELYDAEGKPAIKIGKLHGNASLWKLGRKVAELEELRIEDLEISIGKAALTKPSEEPSDEPAEWSVKLPAIKIERGTFALRGEQPLSIDGIAMSGAVAIPAGGAISANRLEVAGTWREKKLPIVITGGVELDAGLSVPDARIKVGDLLLVATGLVVDSQQPSGTVRITGSPESISAVVPALELPAGVNVAIEMRPSGRAADLSIAGSFGDARVNGAFHADLEKRTAAGFLGADKVNLRRLLRSTGTRPPINVKGELALAVTADMNGVKGIIGVHGAAKDLPESDATIAIDATWKDAAVTVLATGQGESQVAVNARVKRDGKTLTIEHARVVASAKELSPATGKLVDVAAQQLVVDAKLSKPAAVLPKLDLVFDGSVRGTRVATGDIVVGNVDTSFTGSLRDKLYIQSTTRVRNAYQGGVLLGSGTVAANLLPDGRIFSRVDLKPAAAAVGVVASGYITAGDTVKVALAEHAITPAVGSPWSGKGGTVTIVPATGEVRVRDVVTTSGSGRAKVEAVILGDTIDASVDAQGLPLAAVDPAYRGTVSGQLAVKRRGVRWDGGGTLIAQGLVIDPSAPVFDGDVKIGVAGRKVTLDAHAKSADIGGVRFELEVEGPRDLTDFAAWKRLQRTAVRTAVISADKVTLDALSSMGGNVEGKLRIGGTEVEGSVDVKKVMTPLGTAEGTVTFTPLGNDLYASWNAMLSDVGEANIGLRVRFPQHPFDPAEWKQLNRGIVQSLTASFDDIAIDPVKLAKLGIELPYSGRADIRLAVGSAASAATLDVDLRNIEGGELKKPIDLHAEATTDGTGTVASACVQRAKDGACAKGLTSATTVAKLLEIKDVKIPVTFDTWLTAPKTALGVAVKGTLSIPTQSAPAYFALIGRDDFDSRKGTLEGTITIDGTVGRPTGTGTFKLQKLQLISLVEGRMIPELKEMTISARWDGDEADLKVIALESNKGELTITASARPQKLADGRGSFKADKFDLAPLAAFLPGELAASQGELNGFVNVKSFDLETMRFSGGLTVSKADVPIDPMIGTLRNGELQLLSTAKGYSLRATGLLNGCHENPRCGKNVKLDASTPTDLSTLEATLLAEKISTIGEIEPVIDGKAQASLTRRGGQWTGDIYITGRKRNEPPSITVPVSTGDDLLDFEAPDDIYFTDKPPPKQVRFGDARAPTKAWLDARLHIASTQINVEEYGVTGAIVAERPLRLQVGDAIGLDGAISIEYGTAADIFGRAYELEQNEIVRFDGTIDPEIDLQLFHRFPELTLRVTIQGRLSDPGFPPKPTFTADQGNYTEDQLFGFFLGADPGGAASAQATDVAKGAGSSLLSQAVAKKLKNVLPKKLQVIDYIGCEAATSASGSSCSAGKRLLDGRVYISLKKRLTPTVSENPEELLLQYYLSTEWYIEGSGGTGSIVGTDLLWRRRW